MMERERKGALKNLYDMEQELTENLHGHELQGFLALKRIQDLTKEYIRIYGKETFLEILTKKGVQ